MAGTEGGPADNPAEKSKAKKELVLWLSACVRSDGTPANHRREREVQGLEVVDEWVKSSLDKQDWAVMQVAVQRMEMGQGKGATAAYASVLSL